MQELVSKMALSSGGGGRSRLFTGWRGWGSQVPLTRELKPPRAAYQRPPADGYHSSSGGIPFLGWHGVESWRSGV